MRSPSYFREARVNDYAEFTAIGVQLREGQIATLDELPEADTSDLVRAYEYQRTIDENYLES